jgi:hypothetical protein
MEPGKGERVKVEYEGTLIREGAGSTTCSIQDSEGLFHCYVKKTVKLTVLDPDSWPPVRGDVWKTENGKHYHYIGDLQETMRMRPSNGRGYEDVSLSYIKARKPVLVFREGM